LGLINVDAVVEKEWRERRKGLPIKLKISLLIPPFLFLLSNLYEFMISA
jgi:hypothetical protein